MLPSVFCKLPRREKATVIAFINEKVKQDKKQSDEIKRKMK